MLSKAAAIVSGFGVGDEQFHRRFNFYLLALPEVVDPLKTADDARLVHQIGKRIFPMLKPSIDPSPVVANADKVFVTARGVYPSPKPEELAVRLSYREGNGDALATKVVEEKEDDDAGWLRTSLYTPFAFERDASGRRTAFGDVRSAKAWARAGDAPLESTFWVAPGFHSRIREFFDTKQKVLAQQGTRQASLADLARLDICTAEVMRVFVLGKDFRLRSWPVEALDQGLELAKALLGGKTVARPSRGDRTFGISLDAGASIPCRAIWNEAATDQKREAWVFFAPQSWDENFAIDGLALDPRELLGTKPRVIVFLHHPSGVGYIPGVQRLLRREFEVPAERTHLVGILDGGVRLNYALQLFDGKVAELVQIGGATPDADLLVKGETEKFRVVPAYGLPNEKGLANLRIRLKSVFGRADHPRLRIEGIGPRSISDAVLGVLGR